MTTPMRPGKPECLNQPILDQLIQERDTLIHAARNALIQAEEEIVKLNEQLELAAQGKPYLRMSGAGRAAMRPIEGLNAGIVSAAFDAIERVANLTEEDH